MASITGVLGRIKSDLEPYLSEQSIHRACEAAGHKYRRRKFDPVTTIHLFVLQILCFNTALTHLRHLAKRSMTAAAFCKARQRLPLAVVQALLRESAAAMAQASQSGSQALWQGLRTWLVDGSSTITPDSPALDKAFGHPSGQKKGCGFPVPKLLGLFDAYTGLIVEVLSFPLFTHEMSKVAQLHPLLGKGDLLVGDRGFCSFCHLALLHLRQVAGCFRLHQRQIAELYDVRWQVETHFGELKTTLRMRKLKCRSVAGVQKEMAVYALVYNLVHAVMLKAAAQQQVDPDRISFLDAVRWLLSATPGEPVPALIVNPRRPDRHEPRVIKDLQDTYRKMTKSRKYLRRHPQWANRNRPKTKAYSTSHVDVPP